MNAARIGLPLARLRAATLGFSLSCTALVVLGGLSTPAAHGQPALPVSLPGHVLQADVLARAQPAPATVQAGTDPPMTLTVVMRRSDEAGFQRLLADLYDKSSPRYRKFLTPVEVAEAFGPAPDDYRDVEAHFAAYGFTVAERSGNRMTLTLRGTRSKAEAALRTRVVDLEIDGRRFHANQTEPILPEAIARKVHSIAGLSNLAVPTTLNTQQQHEEWQKGCQWIMAFLLEWEAFSLFAFGIASEFVAIAGGLEFILCTGESLGYAWYHGNPRIRLAGADPLLTSHAGAPRDPLPGAGLANGAGQRVGLVQFDTFQRSDVADWLALWRLPARLLDHVGEVHVNGGATLGAGVDEVLLDLAIVMSIAPEADVVIYDAPLSTSFQTVFNAAINGGSTIISNSWAYCENQTTAADVLGIETILQAAAASGISVFNAAGDKGSTCLNGSPNTAHVPASSPTATAVGGTSATGGPALTTGTEVWWNGAASTPPTGSGGFGVSRFFARPSYQNGFTTSTFRSIPDVSAHADPANGMMICRAAGGGCPNGLLYGGTSMSAPAWAAHTALLNQALGGPLGFVNPTLYPLAGSAAFRGPAALGSDFAHVGLGTPRLESMFLAISGQSTGPPDAAASDVADLVAGADRSKLVPTGYPADGTTEVLVRVALFDAARNPVGGKTVTLTQNAGTSAVITPASAVTSAGGTAVFRVKNSVFETVTLTANETSANIVLDTPLTIVFAPPKAASASIQAFPTAVNNNGTATTTITVTLQDALLRPAPGKRIALSQGSGRSIITAPDPPVTNASGQIQFTATNVHTETVTYTAVVVTDGDLPVPGSAVVTWSGSTPALCVSTNLPNAAPGYSITPFATGFSARTFSYSNVNWGCAGASNPAFNPDGSFLIANFSTGALYSLPPEGGAASSGSILSTPGLTIGQPVYGKDGKLYAFRGATGSGFFSGAIYEIDPATGATLRTLATGLACLSPMSVDPISGDLFFTGTCFGFGSDDPNLYRVRNPGSATPLVEIYATLPGTPNGALSFAPDGTIFVATQYLLPSPPVVRVSGTSQPQPPTVTPITGLASFFWVTVAETLPNGAAKSLVILGTDNKMKLADITVSPPTLTEIIDKGMSSGLIGPDGCLYLSDLETIYKLAPANGACTGTPTNPSPGISITPAITNPNPTQGTSITLSAKLIGVPPIADIPVRFHVYGANERERIVRTNASGIATLELEGVFAGSDRIRAWATLGETMLDSNVARITWNAGPHTVFLSLNGTVSGAFAGTPVQLHASLFDVSVNPNAPVAGVTLQFSVGGQSCNAVTNAAGVATCSVTLPSSGNYTLLVAFAGTGGYTPSSASEPFTVANPAPPPCSTFNDVDSTSAFCPNVDWIKNRAVTLGCQVALYCPGDPVIRLQMAAFMNRLGTALSPPVYFAQATPGAIDLDANPVLCQTSDFAAGNYARSILVDGALSGTGTSDVAFSVIAVASFDAGATWQPIATQQRPALAPANHWGHVRAEGAADLNPSQSARFGLRVGRGGLAGTADLTGSTCKLRAAIQSRG